MQTVAEAVLQGGIQQPTALLRWTNQ